MAGWKFETVVPAAAAEVFAAAVESLCPTVTMFEVPGSTLWRIEGYAAEMTPHADAAAAMAIAAARSGVAEPVFTCVPLPDSDWVAENQRSFQPLAAGRFFIQPSHFDGAPPHGTVALTVDAGAAFGTGEHATTKSCLLALDGLAKRRRFRRPLDLGCGSGILALAMAAAWRCNVTASDIDPLSVAVARENAAINGLSAWLRFRCSDGISDREIRNARAYDLIMANILAKPLVALSHRLSGCLAPGGVLVLSGLLAQQESAVRNAYRRQGLPLLRRIALDGWHTLIVGRSQRC
jgi:ribosomal protein L11 methyltransferase